MDLLSELKRIQGERSLYRFAADMGITYSTLWRFYHSQSGLSRKTARRLCAKYPELDWPVGQYFNGRNERAA